MSELRLCAHCNSRWGCVRLTSPKRAFVDAGSHAPWCREGKCAELAINVDVRTDLGCDRKRPCRCSIAFLGWRKTGWGLRAVNLELLLKNVAASGLKALVLQAQTLTLKKAIDAWSEVPPAPGHGGALNSRGRIHMLLYCVTA